MAEAHRREWAFVLAATVRVTGDIDLAEECVQDAYTRALATWSTRGIPAKPGAWLTTVARRRAVDLARRGATYGRALPRLVERAEGLGPEDPDTPEIVDDRLRLIFTCCHPAIGPDAQRRTDAPSRVRAHDGGGGARVLGERGHHGGPHHTGQEEDRPCAHPVSGAPGGGAPFAHRCGAHGRPPPVLDRAHRAGRRRPAPPRPRGALTRPGPRAAHVASR